MVETLFTDPMQSGQNMRLALMFSLGLRNGEACGGNFWKPYFLTAVCIQMMSWGSEV